MSRAAQDRSSDSIGFEDSTRYLVVRLWREWLRRYLKLLLAAVFFMVIVAAAGSFYPLLIKLIFDLFEGTVADTSYPWLLQDVATYLAGTGETGIYFLPVMILVVTVVAGGANYFQSVLSSKFTLSVMRDFQNAMFGHLMRADLAWLQEARAGALISRFINDINLMRSGLGVSMTGIARDLLKLVFLAAVMVYLNWQLALAVAVLFPLGARPILRIGRRMRRASTHLQTEAGELTSTLEEAISGVRFVKAYGMEGQQQGAARSTFQRVLELRLKMVKGRARTHPITETFGGIAFGAVLAYAAHEIIAGQATLGDFSGFLIALPMAYQPMRSLGKLNTAMQEGLAAVKRTFDLLDRPPGVVDRPDAKELILSRDPSQETSGGADIRFENVVFSYHKGESDTVAAPALRGVDLEVPAGQTVALVGPSGAGKSTILNLVLRFYDVTAGAVLVDGQNVRDLTMASLRAHMALVSQDVTLFNDTVAANIGFGCPGASEQDIIAAAKSAAAHDFIAALPDGYQTNVGDRGAKFSGGERQRIAIARAMLRDAPILLLDEATSALDAESEHQVQAALTRLSQGRTTIVIAHRLSTVMGADKIYVLDEGRVVEAGGHDELRAARGLYERLCQLQFRSDLAAGVNHDFGDGAKIAAGGAQAEG